MRTKWQSGTVSAVTARCDAEGETASIGNERCVAGKSNPTKAVRFTFYIALFSFLSSLPLWGYLCEVK